MVRNEYYKIKIDSRNRDKYKALGYQVRENEKELSVKFEHLPRYTELRIEVVCDCCGTKYVSQVNSILLCREKHNKDLCFKCKRDALYNDKYGKMPSYIMEFFRSRMKRWYEDSLDYNQRKCVVTGEHTVTVHHPYPFRKILFEAFEETKMDVRKSIDMYSEEEKNIVSEKCLELHYKYGLGVCMSNKVHLEYHSKYGTLNNTRENVNEFIKNHKNSS